MSKCNPKPYQLHVLSGNEGHRTKDELVVRAEAQLHLGTLNFLPSPLLLADHDAVKLWDDLTKMILNVESDFITNFDTKLLESYCLTCAEKDRQEKTKQEIYAEGKKKGKTAIETSVYINKSGVQTTINKLTDLSIRLITRLGLDPLSRLNALKNKNKPKEDELKEEFGGL